MPNDTAAAPQSDRLLENVKVEVGILIGKARPTMAALSSLDVETVLSLDSAIDDPVQVCIGNRVIAEGMLEELTDTAGSSIGVRITRIIEQQSS